MRTVLAFLVLALAAVAADAGVVIHMAAKDLPSGTASGQTVYYAQGGSLRMDSLDDRGHVTSFDLVRDGVIWRVDVTRRTYRKFDKASVQAQTQVADQRFQAILANLPPERRAMIEQRMKKLREGPTDITWSDTGRSDKAGSFGCGSRSAPAS